MLQDHRHGGVPVVGQCAGEHFVQHHAGGVQVAAGVDVAATRLLRRDIVDAAQGLLGHGALGVGDAGDAEVGHLHAAVPEDHDVLGLDVPVDDAPAVGVAQRLEDLTHEVQRLPPIQAAAALAHILLQGDAFDELHDDVFHAVGLVDVEDVDDVGMVELGHRLGFVVEPVADLLVLCQLRLQDLDGHHPVQPVTFRFVNDRHPARPQDVQDLVSVVEKFTYVLIHSVTPQIPLPPARPTPKALRLRCPLRPVPAQAR